MGPDPARQYGLTAAGPAGCGVSLARSPELSVAKVLHEAWCLLARYLSRVTSTIRSDGPCVPVTTSTAW